MATIANLAVQLTCNPSAFSAGLTTAGRSLSRFAGLANPSRLAAGINGGFGAASKSISSFLNPMRDLLSAIPVVGGAFAAIPTSMGAALGIIKENIREMAAATKQADRLGLSIENYGAITTLAGADSELMDRALFKMSANLGELSVGSQAAADKFALLGFQARDFAGLNTEQSLAEIMDRFAGMSSFAEKAYLATELMGRGAITLVPALSKGSAGLAQAAKRARELGLSFDGLQAAGVMRAAQSMKQIDLISKGLQRQFAIEFAPIVGSIAESFTSWLKSAGGMRGAFAGMAEGAGHFLGNTVSGLAVIIEEMAQLIDMFHDVKGAADFAKSSVAWMDKITPTGMVKKLFGGGQLTDAAGGEKFKTGAKFLQDLGVKLQNLPAFFSGAAKKAQGLGDSLPNQRIAEMTKKAGELADSLEVEIAAYGRSSQVVAMNKLARQGATEAMLAGVRASIEEIDTLNRISDRAATAMSIFDDFRAKSAELAAAWAAGKISAQGLDGALTKVGDAMEKNVAAKAAEAFRSTRTPLEMFGAKLAELDEMLDRQAITWDTYTRSVDMAAGALKGVAEVKGAATGAQEFGSQAAYKTISDAQFGSTGGTDALTRLQETMKQSLELEKKRTADMAELARAARRGFKEVKIG